MSVLCGIDFSKSSNRAAEVAAGIAARLNQPLYVVHALTNWLGEDLGDVQSGVLTATRRALEKEAVQLRKSGAEVHAHVEMGAPMDFLPRAAELHSASMMVVGATGRGEARGVRVGSQAERLVRDTKLPVLVVRETEPFKEWLASRRPLRVVVALDFDATSDGAWQWATGLGAVAPVELVGLHVYWPPRELQRLGLTGMHSLVDADPEVDRVLRRELARRFTGSDRVRVTWRVEATIGRVADHILTTATEERADLVVVGSHRRNLISRLWEGSTSRGVLHNAQVSVALVPGQLGLTGRTLPSHQVALVATDLSPSGSAAIEHAYAAVGKGGTVHLIHVLRPSQPRSVTVPHDIFEKGGTDEAAAAARSRLQELIPHGELVAGRTTEVHVLESSEEGNAISQAAERLGVDLICVGVRERFGATGVSSGVVEDLLRSTRRPVLLVRPSAV